MLTQILEKRNIPPLLEKEEMLAILQEEVYGQMPPKPERVTWEVQEDYVKRFCANKASFSKAINSEAYFSGNSTWCLNVLGIMTHWNYLLTAQEGEGRIAQASRLQTEQWKNFTEGKRPEEEALTTLKSIGREELMEVCQNAYDRQEK